MQHHVRVVLMHDETSSPSSLYNVLMQSSELVLVRTITHPSQLLSCVQTSQANLVILELQQVSMTVMWQLVQLHLHISTVQSLACLTEPTSHNVWGLIAAGITGYLHMDDIPHSLSDAIKNVRRGGIWCSPTMVPLIQAWSGTQPGPHTIMPNPYEVEIITRVAQGQTNRQIAHALEVNERTIRFHLEQLYRRWGVDNRTQAAIFAQEQGWIDENTEERSWVW